MQEVINDTKLYKALNRYKTRYLHKSFENLDESSTRIIINHLLTDVLGYRELVDIKTEYPIKGGYIDYLIEINNKKIFAIEVKSISTKLSHKHLRQATYYGSTIGVEWIIITNSRFFQLYKIKYTKPLKVINIFNLDLKKLDYITNKQISYITKKSIIRGDLSKGYCDKSLF